MREGASSAYPYATRADVRRLSRADDEPESVIVSEPPDSKGLQGRGAAGTVREPSENRTCAISLPFSLSTNNCDHVRLFPARPIVASGAAGDSIRAIPHSLFPCSLSSGEIRTEVSRPHTNKNLGERVARSTVACRGKPEGKALPRHPRPTLMTARDDRSRLSYEYDDTSTVRMRIPETINFEYSYWYHTV